MDELDRELLALGISESKYNAGDTIIRLAVKNGATFTEEEMLDIYDEIQDAQESVFDAAQAVYGMLHE